MKKKHMNGQALMPQNNGGSGMGSNNDQSSKTHSKKKRFQGNCNYCREFRHKEADCRKKAADADRELDLAMCFPIFEW